MSRLGQLYRRLRWNKLLARRIQRAGSILLAISSVAMAVFELWAIWFASLHTLTAIVLVGSVSCLIGTGVCWIGGGPSGAHIFVGVLSLAMSVGCAYLLRDVTGLETVIGTVGLLMFGPGGAMLLSGRGDPYPFPD